MATTKDSNRGFKQRWREWWYGAPAAPASLRAVAPPPPPPEKPQPKMQKGTKPLWEGDVAELHNYLWGEGYAVPTEADFCSRMYPQLGVNNAMTVLDVGDGLAGASMSITKGFQSFVDCHLTTPDGVAPATRLLQKNKVATKVSLYAYDLQPIQLSKRYNGLSLRRVLWRVPDAAEFMTTASNQLKEHSRLVMTEYLAETPVLSLESVSKWFLDEQFKGSMSLGYLLNILEKNGYEVRVADDITAQHRADIRAGLEAIRNLVMTHQVVPTAQPAIIAEANNLVRQVSLLDDGVQLYRFFAQRRK